MTAIAAAAGTPTVLNGHPVIRTSAHESCATVMVDRGSDNPHRFVVATWAPILGNTWSWGHYCADLVEANKEFAAAEKRNAHR